MEVREEGVEQESLAEEERVVEAGAAEAKVVAEKADKVEMAVGAVKEARLLSEECMSCCHSSYGRGNAPAMGYIQTGQSQDCSAQAQAMCDKGGNGDQATCRQC